MRFRLVSETECEIVDPTGTVLGRIFSTVTGIRVVSQYLDSDGLVFICTIPPALEIKLP